MKAFCINLERRADRWTEFTSQTLPFSVTRVEGVEHENGSVGCIAAHLKAMKLFKADEMNLLMEDDCQFIQPWSEVEKAIKELPANWDILYLGAMLHTPLFRYSDHLHHLQKGWGSHAVIYNGTKVSKLITEFSAEQIHDDRKNIDTWMVAHVQTNFKCFITDPLICVQRPGFSEITKRERNYPMIEHYKRFTI